jgi:ribosomal protein S18 acetylase RimI-like enzyme
MTQREPKGIHVRLATTADIKLIDDLGKQVDEYHVKMLPDIFKHYTEPRPQKRIEDWIKKEAESAYLLAFKCDRLVGFLNIMSSSYPKYPMFRETAFALVENCVVDKRYRRKGIGKKLFLAATEWVRRKGLGSIQLTVWQANKPALKFYQSLGFKTLHQRMSLEI